MADVQVQNPPPDRGTPGWLWALVVLIIVAVLAWFVLNRTDAGDAGDDVDVNIEAPGDAGGGGGGGGGGNP